MLEGQGKDLRAVVGKMQGGKQHPVLLQKSRALCLHEELDAGEKSPGSCCPAHACSSAQGSMGIRISLPFFRISPSPARSQGCHGCPRTLRLATGTALSRTIPFPGEHVWRARRDRACMESAHRERAWSVHGECAWRACVERAREECARGESTHGESARSERGWSEHAQRACTERGCTARAHLLAALAGVQSLPWQRGIRELPPRRPQPSQLSRGFPCYTSGEAALTRSHAKGTYAHTGVGGRIELRTRPRTSCARHSPSGRPPRAAGEQTDTLARCDAALDAEEAMRDSARGPCSGGSGCL